MTVNIGSAGVAKEIKVQRCATCTHHLITKGVTLMCPSILPCLLGLSPSEDCWVCDVVDKWTPACDPLLQSRELAIYGQTFPPSFCVYMPTWCNSTELLGLEEAHEMHFCCKVTLIWVGHIIAGRE